MSRPTAARSWGGSSGGVGFLWPVIISVAAHAAVVLVLDRVPLRRAAGPDPAPVVLFRDGAAAGSTAIRVRLLAAPAPHDEGATPQPDMTKPAEIRPAGPAAPGPADGVTVTLADVAGEMERLRFEVSRIVRGYVESASRLLRPTAGAAEPAVSDAPETPIHNDTGPGPADAGGVERGAILVNLPAPRYPSLSRRRGEEGLVVLEVTVEADGRVGAVRVVEDPGFPLLCEAAVEAVRQATFRPAFGGGGSVSAIVLVPIRFALR